MKLLELREQVLKANKTLLSEGLTKFGWGNVSGIDRDAGMFVIKPTKCLFSELTIEDLVVVDLAGIVVEGHRLPSSDAPTHVELYQRFEQIGGIAHTYAKYTTMMAQAGVELEPLGAMHADHFSGTVPMVRELTPFEVQEGYERNTGRAIVESFNRRKIDPMDIPACFHRYRAAFTWGRDAFDAIENMAALEGCCEVAIGTWKLNPGDDGLPDYIMQKRQRRKLHRLK